MNARRALAVAALALAGCAPSVATATAHAPARSSAEYLVDGATLGSAASAKPGHGPPNGIGIYQESAGAWKLCFTGSGNVGTIYLCSAPDWHMSVFVDPTGHVGPSIYWAQLGAGGVSQTVTLKVYTPESFQVVFKGGKILCAGGGVGSTDKAVISQHCSEYHQSWDWDTHPTKGGKIVNFPSAP